MTGRVLSVLSVPAEGDSGEAIVPFVPIVPADEAEDFGNIGMDADRLDALEWYEPLAGVDFDRLLEPDWDEADWIGLGLNRRGFKSLETEHPLD